MLPPRPTSATARLRAPAALATLAACVLVALGACPPAQALEAGASAVDVTPQKLPAIVAGGFLEAQSSKIVDRLYTRTLVLREEGVELALVVVDTCMMTRALTDEAKALASKETGIPADRILVSATHTHSAPAAMACLGTRLDKDYAAWLPGKIAEGIATAHRALQPARLGWGSVEDWDHTFCRRWIRRPDKILTDPFGNATARANMHPGHESADVTGPSGPVDPGLTVLSVQTADGKPLAFWANYSMHYFGAPAVSADYYGAFARHIARLLGQPSSEGPAFVAAMTQGTSGDQQWMDYSKPRRQISMDAYAEEVARRALEAHANIQHVEKAPLAMKEVLLTLRYRVPDAKRLEWARPISAKIQNDVPKDKQEVYAREALILHERQQTEVKLQALRIGGLSINALPNEVYAITGLKLKARGPLPAAMNIELANGGEGYIPPPEQHELGGYTTWPARTAGLEPQAEPRMVEALLAAQEEITGLKRRQDTPYTGAYARAVLESKPAGYWHLDDMEAHRAAAVTGPELAYEPGSARYLPGPQGPGLADGARLNRAPHFAGGRLLGPAATATDYSVEFWFWNALPANARPVTAYLVSRGPAGDKDCPGDHLGIGGTHADAPAGRLFVYNGNKANRLLAGRTPLGLRQWHHVVICRQGGRVRVHLDGAETPEIEGDLPATHTPADHWFAAGRSDSFATLEGKLDELALYPRALSPAEIAAHYQAAGVPRPRPATQTPPLSPEASLKKWHIRKGYQIELVAAEPLVLDPVAFDWDEQGRLWVVEMADYPLGMDGNGKAGGRVVRLEDTDKDGRYDKRVVFAHGLNFPTGILTWRGGALVTAAPDVLLLRDTDGDGAADEQKALLTGFSTGNQQLRVNGLRWGMDGWVYCAAGAHNAGYNKATEITSILTGEKIILGSRDFRFKPDTGEFDPLSGPAQFGRACDDWGRWFGVQNSHPLWHYVLEDYDLRRNPHVIPPNPLHHLFPRNPPVYPASALEKRFHSFDQAGRFTSACGIEIYRDTALFVDDQDDPAPATHAFTCEPFANLIQHHVLMPDGVTFQARRAPAEKDLDFAASEDRWCRPVMVRTGPEGALYIADMYRYMIEHPQWLPQNGKDELLPHYREGDDKGRIYRIVKTGPAAARVPPPAAPPAISLGSTNGWLRDRAQMLALSPQGEEALRGAARVLVEPGSTPAAIAQAAWTLDQRGLLPDPLLALLLMHDEPEVLAQAVKMAGERRWENLEEALLMLVNGPKFQQPRIRLALTLAAGHWRGDWPADLLGTVLAEAPRGSILEGAALSSLLPHLARVSSRFAQADSAAAEDKFDLVFRCALAAQDSAALTTLMGGRLPPHRVEQLLACLEEARLSLPDLASRLQTAPAAAGMKKIQALLTEAAARTSAGQARLEDLRFLACDRDRRAQAAAHLPALWAAAPVDQAAPVLALITRLQPAEAPAFLLQGWAGRTPVMRQSIIETLLSHDAWTLALLKAVQDRVVEPAAFDAAARARLLKHPKKEAQKLAAAVFAGTPGRAEVIARFKPALALKGNPAAGKTTFGQLCASCHKLDGLGMDLGPDLRSVVQHEPEKLLNSILDPSAIIEPGFTAYHCTLQSGEQLYGVIATETSASLTLKLPGNLLRPLLRADIASLKSTQTSLMPEGLEAALTPQSLADLIAYLKQPR